MEIRVTTNHFTSVFLRLAQVKVGQTRGPQTIVKEVVAQQFAFSNWNSTKYFYWTSEVFARPGGSSKSEPSRHTDNHCEEQREAHLPDHAYFLGNSFFEFTLDFCIYSYL